jgi:hypothetical protein
MPMRCLAAFRPTRLSRFFTPFGAENNRTPAKRLNPQELSFWHEVCDECSMRTGLAGRRDRDGY